MVFVHSDKPTRFAYKDRYVPGDGENFVYDPENIKIPDEYNLNHDYSERTGAFDENAADLMRGIGATGDFGDDWGDDDEDGLVPDTDDGEGSRVKVTLSMEEKKRIADAMRKAETEIQDDDKTHRHHKFDFGVKNREERLKKLMDLSRDTTRYDTMDGPLVFTKWLDPATSDDTEALEHEARLRRTIGNRKKWAVRTGYDADGNMLSDEEVEKMLAPYKRPPAVAADYEKPLCFFAKTFEQFTDEETFQTMFSVYGTTKDGKSVHARLHGFYPYMYVKIPDSFTNKHAEDVYNALNYKIADQHGKPLNDRWKTKRDAQGNEYREKIKVAYKDHVYHHFALGWEKLRAAGKKNSLRTQLMRQIPVVSVQIVEKEVCKSLADDIHARVFKITYAHPLLRNDVKRMVQERYHGPNQLTEFYEVNIPPLVRMLVDQGEVGACSGQWMTVRPENVQFLKSMPKWLDKPGNEHLYAPQVRNAPPSDAYVSIEFFAHLNHLQVHPTDAGDFTGFADMIVLSHDWECVSRLAGQFPQSERDPKNQVSLVLAKMLDMNSRVRILIGVGSIMPVPNTIVWEVSDEAMLSQIFALQFDLYDPELITGWNINGFDIPYMEERDQWLVACGAMAANPSLRMGRHKTRKAGMYRHTFFSKARGHSESYRWDIPGRIVYDMLELTKIFRKMSSYSLNAVSAAVLTEKGKDANQKLEINHSLVGVMQDAGPRQRALIAAYCCVDSELVVRIMDKEKRLFTDFNLARVCGVEFSSLYINGQQHKVFSMLLHKCGRENVIIPEAEPAIAGKYAGAHVFTPRIGYYRTITFTLDFASLYPSIMISKNLCYTTRIEPENLAWFKWKYGADSFETSPSGDHWAKKDVKEGILPRMLKTILDARKRAKKEMRAAKDPIAKGVLDGRQLALKISANSVYGFTGAVVGKMPLVPLALSVTSWGKEWIQGVMDRIEADFKSRKDLEKLLRWYYKNKELVEELVTKLWKTCEGGLSRVYGDTDSVMLDTMFRGEKEERLCAAVAKAVEHWINTVMFDGFERVKLELEKLYFQMMTFNKKRYAGLLREVSVHYDDPDDKDMITDISVDAAPKGPALDPEYKGPDLVKFDYKGIELKRRDNTQIVRVMQYWFLYYCIVEADPDKALESVVYYLNRLRNLDLPLSMLIDSAGFNKPLSSYAAAGKRTKSGAVAALPAHIAYVMRAIERDPTNAPRVGERIFYLKQVPGKKMGSKDGAVSQSVEDPMYLLFKRKPLWMAKYEEAVVKAMSRLMLPLLGPEKTAKFFAQNAAQSFRSNLSVLSYLNRDRKVDMTVTDAIFDRDRLDAYIASRQIECANERQRAWDERCAMEREDTRTHERRATAQRKRDREMMEREDVRTQERAAKRKRELAMANSGPLMRMFHGKMLRDEREREYQELCAHAAENRKRQTKKKRERVEVGYDNDDGPRKKAALQVSMTEMFSIRVKCIRCHSAPAVCDTKDSDLAMNPYIDGRLCHACNDTEYDPKIERTPASIRRVHSRVSDAQKWQLFKRQSRASARHHNVVDVLKDKHTEKRERLMNTLDYCKRCSEQNSQDFKTCESRDCDRFVNRYREFLDVRELEVEICHKTNVPPPEYSDYDLTW